MGAALRWLSGVLLFVLIGLGVVWQTWVRPPEPLRFGLALNLTGVGGTAGEYIREGAILAVEEVNATGGINGRRLELLIKDDRNTREGIIEADEALIAQGVMLIIGHVTSDNSLIAHPLVTSRNVLLFTPFSATTQLSGQDDLFFRTSVDVQHYGRPLADLLTAKGARSAAFLMDMGNPAFVEDYFTRTAHHFDGKTIPIRFNPEESENWNAVLQELLGNEPDTIVLLTEASMTGIAAQKLRARGFAGPLVATLWAQTPDLPRYGGDAVEGLSLVTFIDPDNDRPEFLRFSGVMQQRLNKPANARSTRAYEAVMILAQALRRSQELTVTHLKEQLLTDGFETLMGTVRFDRYGDVERPIFEVQVRNRQFMRVRQLK